MASPAHYYKPKSLFLETHSFLNKPTNVEDQVAFFWPKEAHWKNVQDYEGINRAFGDI
jgi:hypothetical protein